MREEQKTATPQRLEKKQDEKQGDSGLWCQPPGGTIDPRQLSCCLGLRQEVASETVYTDHCEFGNLVGSSAGGRWTICEFHLSASVTQGRRLGHCC